VRVVLVLMLALSSPAAAQDSVGAGTRLAVTVGLTRTDRRDDNASPLRYGGFGPSAEVAYSHRGPHWHLIMRAGLAWGTLASQLTTGSVPQESHGEAWVDAELLRGTRWRIGVLANGRATDWTHIYDGPSGYPASFSFLSTSVAPVLGWQRRRERSGLALRFAVPVIAWVRRPYSDDRVATAANQKSRLETVAHFQSFDLRASVAARIGRRSDFLLEYRLIGQRHDRIAPFRSLSGTASGGVSVRVGRLP
jgi:hypothetical protein